MQDPSKKYRYQVPKLEEYILETKKDVFAKIDELAHENKEDFTEDDIKKLYRSHKSSANNNDFFKTLLRILEQKQIGSIEYQKIRSRFLNFVIIHEYYAYIYTDFPQFALTLDYISIVDKKNYILNIICYNVYALYDKSDYEKIIIPIDPVKKEIGKKLRLLEGEYTDIKTNPKSSVRKQGNAMLHLYQAQSTYYSYFTNTKLKPIHYFASGFNIIDTHLKLSNHALMEIIRYHLQNQDERKKFHNRNYRKVAKQKEVKLPSINVQAIANWMLNNSKDLSKKSCAAALGINTTTVYRNWTKAKTLKLQNGKNKKD